MISLKKYLGTVVDWSRALHIVKPQFANLICSKKLLEKQFVWKQTLLCLLPERCMTDRSYRYQQERAVGQRIGTWSLVREPRHLFQENLVDNWVVQEPRCLRTKVWLNFQWYQSNWNSIDEENGNSVLVDKISQNISERQDRLPHRNCGRDYSLSTARKKHVISEETQKGLPRGVTVRNVFFSYKN